MTKYAELRFFAELRDFLSDDRRSGLVTRTFDVAGSVKDMIEACGVPHTEVAAILIGGHAVDFSYRVQHRDLPTHLHLADAALRRRLHRPSVRHPALRRLRRGLRGARGGDGRLHGGVLCARVSRWRGPL